MKKYITDIKTLAALLMAGVAFAACSSDENITNEAQQPAAPAKHYTMTVNATKGDDGTRALALDGKTLKVKWANTDQVAVFPETWRITPLGTLTAAASETGSTTLSGDLTGTTINVNDKLSLLFPRGEWDYTGQKGVLLSDENSIEKKYDYALADVTVESTDNDNIKTTDAHFTNQQAIVKFILKDKANNNAINAKKLTISAASNKLLTRKTLAGTGDRIYHSGYTATSGSGGIDGDDQNNLVDGDLSTKWCASSPWYIEFHTASPIKVDGYMLRTANDTKDYPGRNPTSWVLKGKTTSDGNWTTIDEKSGYDEMPATNYTERDFEATTPGTYQYFRLEISAIKEGTIMQLSEMKLFTDATGPTEFNDYGPVVVTPASAASELTVALRNENAGADTYTITAATADGETYKLEKTGVNFVNGKYYEITAKLTKQTTIDLSALTENKTIQDGYTLTGTLANHVQLTIADGATVTFDGVSINANGAWNSGSYAGISCLGDATIILKEGTTNTVGGDDVFPAIEGAKDKTLTITGTGSLNALSNNGRSAGIGSGYAAGKYNSKTKACGDIFIAGGIITARGGAGSPGIGAGEFGTCGNITISGGTVKAIGSTNAAGIGSGYSNEGTCGDITITGGNVEATGGLNGTGIGTSERGICGSITISGGTVTATGGQYAAGIGSGYNGTCGNITITNGVTKVTATKGSSATYSIGTSSGASCGTITIGGTETGVISESPYTYKPE